MTRATRLVMAIFAACAAVTAAVSAADRCSTCLWTRYWSMPQPEAACKTTGVPCFPETDALANRPSLGLAFSGGGTRSATLTLGQLRGLHHAGFLARARYVSAVSGGSWAAVPFVYSKSDLDTFLGQYEPPAQLDRRRVVVVPNGQLARAIVDSSLAAGSVREVVGDFGALFSKDVGNGLIRTLVTSLSGASRREADRLNKTYARLLGRIFIDPLVEPGTTASRRLFSWTEETVDDISTINQGRIGNDMIVVGPNRPFLIANGTVISARPEYEYPQLLPIEYTPLYVGVRQRFGARFGGVYVSPWAYDTVRIGEVNRDKRLIQVQYEPTRSFTLGDVVASSGAAPQLAIVLGTFAPESFRSRVQQIAQVFPAFRHFTVADDAAIRSIATEEIGHGDGGFSDNLGIIPLLARGVRNVMVFINTNTELAENNDDLKSLFFPVGPRNGTGDKTRNVVFEDRYYKVLVDELTLRREQHKAQVYCAGPWTVLPNQHYAVAGFDGVRTCWFYNSPDQGWADALPDPLRAMVGGHDQTPEGKHFENFPWFATFAQNKTHVVQLTTPQVNLLSNLSAWIVSSKDTTDMIQRTLVF